MRYPFAIISKCFTQKCDSMCFTSLQKREYLPYFPEHKCRQVYNKHIYKQVATY